VGGECELSTECLRKRIDRGETVFGTFMKLPSSQVVEIFGLAGLDFVILDTEHGPLSFESIETLILAAEVAGINPLVRVYDNDSALIGRALDLGAAPGGWTQELLSRGLQVLAVDTGELDPRLAGVPGLRFLQANVKHLRLSPQDQFDLITCDMSWDPIFTAKLVNGLVGHLRSGGQVIMTVKLMGKKPLPVIERVLNLLDKRLRVSHAQHLWHNRQEITLHLLKV